MQFPFCALLLTCAVVVSTLGGVLQREGNRLMLDGKPVRLIGYGDYGSLSEAEFDHSKFFDLLSAKGLNFTRVWVNYHWTQSLSPYAKTGGKYDLTRQSAPFFARLKTFVGYAASKGIVVQLCLFDANAQESDSCGLRWPRSPFNPQNNVNGYIQNPGDYDQLDSRLWTAVHAPLIRRVAQEVGEFGNVIYEICNEPVTSQPSIGVTFHKAVLEELWAALAGAAGSKVISVNADAPEGQDFMDHNFYKWAIAEERIGMLSFHSPMLATITPKPIIISNDGGRSQQREDQPADSIACARGGEKGYPQREREQLTFEALETLFNVHESPADFGRSHYEFLDKGLMLASWFTQDYNPRTDAANLGIVSRLAQFKPSPLYFAEVTRASVVYVDRSNQGPADGTFLLPFSTVLEGYSAAMAGGKLLVRPGSYPETMFLTKQMTIEASGGAVFVGK